MSTTATHTQTPVRHFERTTVAHGSSMAAALRIVCGCCEASGYAILTATLRQAPPEAITDHFRTGGWKVGATPADDRCPACRRRTSVTNRTKGQDMATAKPRKAATKAFAVKATTALTAAPAPTEAITTAPQADPPPAMDREDRRIITEKLDDVYGDRGYRGSWTDATLARDLNVPRAWVSDVREAFFGPEGSNPLLDEYTAEKEGFDRLHAGFMAARKAHCEEHDRLLKLALDLSGKADEIARIGKRIERELG
ncbi:hypothetical protein [Martelella endophytica]|uniref:Uncharacterized protein n=1 Tax=Martelella endophytica TaxID=1486262 RepID=A0A0D5LS10_MAREN|nr:hypothetical protein [Martelella endophytica]AJY46856.1 hypothetical protein TM49_16140 [Martelella endophytica]